MGTTVPSRATALQTHLSQHSHKTSRQSWRDHSRSRATVALVRQVHVRQLPVIPDKGRFRLDRLNGFPFDGTRSDVGSLPYLKDRIVKASYCGSEEPGVPHLAFQHIKPRRGHPDFPSRQGGGRGLVRNFRKTPVTQSDPSPNFRIA